MKATAIYTPDNTNYKAVEVEVTLTVTEKPSLYWLNTAKAENPEENILKTQDQIDEDMKVLHGTLEKTSEGKDKTAVTAEYTYYMNGKNANGEYQEVRLYTKWNGSDAGDGANRWVEFRIIQVGEHDNDGSAVTFMATHSLPTAQQMNITYTSAGGWTGSEMYKAVFGNGSNTEGYVATGLSGLKDAVKTITKKSTAGSYDTSFTDTTSSDAFWLISYSELAGEDKVSWFKNEGTQYDWCKDNVTNPTYYNPAIAGIDKTRAGSCPESSYYSWWWLRSPDVDSSDGFGCVNTHGHLHNHARADDYLGVAPALAM